MLIVNFDSDHDELQQILVNVVCIVLHWKLTTQESSSILARMFVSFLVLTKQLWWETSVWFFFYFF